MSMSKAVLVERKDFGPCAIPRLTTYRELCFFFQKEGRKGDRDGIPVIQKRFAVDAYVAEIPTVQNRSCLLYR